MISTTVHGASVWIRHAPTITTPRNPPISFWTASAFPLLVQAKDDPLIPFDVYNHPAFLDNPYLRLLAVEHGGHLGFISKTKPRFWLDQVLVNWMEEVRNKVLAVSVLNQW